MGFLRRFSVFSALMLPGVAFATDAVVPSKAYVDDTRVAVQQGTGTNNANVGKALVVDSNGDLAELRGTFTSATSLAAGTAGFVPAPATEADNTKFLKGDGTWAAVPSPATMTGADGTDPGTGGLVPAPAAADNVKFLKGDGTWAVPTDTTYTAVTGNTNDTISDNLTNTTKYTSPKAVDEFAQKKPATVANGMVLSYNGSNANTNVTAGYVKVPVATGAPSSNTPTSFLEIWVQ